MAETIFLAESYLANTLSLLTVCYNSYKLTSFLFKKLQPLKSLEPNASKQKYAPEDGVELRLQSFAGFENISATDPDLWITLSSNRT